MTELSKQAAFPTHPQAPIGDCSDGMTIRTWLAGMAMQGMIVAGYKEKQALQTTAEKFKISAEILIAQMAVEHADALIAELEKTNEN